MRARRAGDRRRRLRACSRTPPGSRRSATSRRSAARWPPERRSCAARATSCSAVLRPACWSDRRDAIAAAAPAPAGPGAADRQALAGGARGHAARCTATRNARGARSPCWRCSTRRADALAARARRLAEAIGERAERGPSRRARSGGGALPLLELEGPAVALDAATARTRVAARAARRRPAGDRADPRRPGAARSANAERRGARARRPRRAAARCAADERRAADARDRRPHRPRQDGADPGADRRRHRSPARGARARDLDRARLRAAARSPRAGGCR